MLTTLKLVLKDPLSPFRQMCWRIGVILNYSEKDILAKSMGEIIWFNGVPEEDFHADPFITDYFGETLIFFEKFHEREYHGDLEYISLDALLSGNVQSKTALRLPTHLSFPFLFEYNQTLYMIPENSESHTISLFKSDDSPDNWQRVSTLISDFDGIDTTLFEYNNTWWMFSTRKIGRTPAENTDLYIWYSDNPLGGWKPHKMNPIKYDTPIARGAGKPFTLDGKLYRPVQDCSRTYGGELLIKEITELTPEEFSEDSVLQISGQSPFKDRIHTFNSNGVVTVIDGARNRYSLLHAWRIFKNMLSRNEMK